MKILKTLSLIFAFSICLISCREETDKDKEETKTVEGVEVEKNAKVEVSDDGQKIEIEDSEKEVKIKKNEKGEVVKKKIEMKED